MDDVLGITNECCRLRVPCSTTTVCAAAELRTLHPVWTRTYCSPRLSACKLFQETKIQMWWMTWRASSSHLTLKPGRVCGGDGPGLGAHGHGQPRRHGAPAAGAAAERGGDAGGGGGPQGGGLREVLRPPWRSTTVVSVEIPLVRSNNIMLRCLIRIVRL